MGRTITRWQHDRNTGKPMVMQGAVSLNAGQSQYIDFGQNSDGMAPDRVVIWSDAATTITWMPSNSDTPGSESAPALITSVGTAGGAVATGAAARGGIRPLIANTPEILEAVNGYRYWHIRNAGASAVVIRCEAGHSAGPNE